MAAHYIREIREAQPEGPYYLGGWSFGGVIAFEMARQLMAAGARIALLALFDTYSRLPDKPADPPRSRFLLWRLRFHLGAVRRLERDQKLRYVMAKVRSVLRWAGRQTDSVWSGILREIRRPLPTAYDRVRAANHDAARHYVPQPYDGTLTLFRATGMGLASSDDPYLGWAEVPGVDIEIIEVPGVHRSILREEEDIRSLAEKLCERLALAQRENEARTGD
jgi:thioesterase domain-containing protein